MEKAGNEHENRKYNDPSQYTRSRLQRRKISLASQKRQRHEALQGRKEKLSEEEQREVDAYVQKHKPRKSVAYILWFLFGTIGGHRYYLRSIESGIMMALFVIVFPYFTFCWWLFDFVQLSHLVETRTLDVQEKSSLPLKQDTSQLNKHKRRNTSPY